MHLFPTIPKNHMKFCSKHKPFKYSKQQSKRYSLNNGKSLKLLNCFQRYPKKKCLWNHVLNKRTQTMNLKGNTFPFWSPPSFSLFSATTCISCPSLFLSPLEPNFTFPASYSSPIIFLKNLLHSSLVQ